MTAGQPGNICHFQVPDDPSATLLLDRSSHFILRLAFCGTEEHRRWLATQEVELFRHRYGSLRAPEKVRLHAGGDYRTGIGGYHCQYHMTLRTGERPCSAARPSCTTRRAVVSINACPCLPCHYGTLYSCQLCAELIVHEANVLSQS